MSTESPKSSRASKPHTRTTAERKSPRGAERTRLSVAKTPKLYINGAFVRPESGRVAVVAGLNTPTSLPISTRKDTRDAVAAARKAQSSWAGRTGYNRGQILYRLAEMLEERREQFENLLELEGGAERDESHQVLSQSIDSLVSDAGWCDKFISLGGSPNSVAGPYLNLSSQEPTGVVGIIPADFAQSIEAVGAVLLSGNSAVLLAGESGGLATLALAEVCESSDLPAGVLNILTASPEAAATLASHTDVNALDLRGANNTAELERAGAASLKRIRPRNATGLRRITWACETKTIWHPTGM